MKFAKKCFSYNRAYLNLRPLQEINIQTMFPCCGEIKFLNIDSEKIKKIFALKVVSVYL